MDYGGLVRPLAPLNASSMAIVWSIAASLAMLIVALAFLEWLRRRGVNPVATLADLASGQRQQAA